ncbi:MULTISPECIES: CpaD family pilus assembly lipoprotein [unclassified Brenneria]|uniref:CpaD family pilus assembly lipoprotein n=1 Tax=unclassified Brenneria TaxID=2634434 RepID=UPI0018F0A455|nr:MULTISPECIES: CpaD family pilus assembly lipoprotein [unclassified Brenneria]MBJ7222713.1 hypothetical protein [Brenneria sp. L3-3C-1]MEE3643956.1 CpaD family pilus assembly lipoprotein [Brenneria sp. L3_3C_1]MEE3651091.1 CpaD family pilus assembly lipoprotein [Brenneria sp. HEZEL_4_2_4]
MAVDTRLRLSALLLIAGGIGLMAGCASWQRDKAGMPDVSSIKLQQYGKRWVAMPPDCYPLLQPDYHWSHNGRRQVAFGCATYTNLAVSLARPQDLSRPRVYSGMQADAAALSVTRYRQNTVEPLRQTHSTSKSGD